MKAIDCVIGGWVQVLCWVIYDLKELVAFRQAIVWCRIFPEIHGICLSSCKCVCELQEQTCQHTKVPRWLFQGLLISAVFDLNVPQRSESRFLVASLNMVVQNWANYWHSQPILFNYRWIHGRKSNFTSFIIDWAMISWPWELCKPLGRALEDTTRCPPMVSWNKSCLCRTLTVKWLPDFVLLQSTLDFQVVLLASPIICNGFEMTV